jgi:septum formation protein
MKKIILASVSPQRKILLEETGLSFEVIPSNYEEDMTLALPPDELVKFLSKKKAENVAENCKNAVIISADTIVYIENKVLGKPLTVEKAQETLRTLSGKTHSVFTGFTIFDTAKNKIVSKTIESKVSFREMSDQIINDYIEKENPLKFAGSYTISKLSEIFIEKIEGDPLNTLGLPVSSVIDTLKEFGVEVLKK